ncbi:hypothetical protein [Pseudacidovorax intermedius]|uniref:hypothetical protein n=1 Tax=Pseudacidovorax intermedius TaxID=433924 RepID=UPI00034CAA46|nr:hypothetical protein [Pseudacidovorax intermedius]
MTNDPNVPVFARAILGGKKTCKVEARVSDEVKEAVRRRWLDLGFASESEYLETLVTIDCYGKNHIRMVRDQQIAMVCALPDTEPTVEGAAS